MNLRGRIDKLMKAMGDPAEECDGPVTCLLDPGQKIPADATKCPKCGAVHTATIVEELVEVMA
jgi:hypothetical protein